MGWNGRTPFLSARPKECDGSWRELERVWWTSGLAAAVGRRGRTDNERGCGDGGGGDGDGVVGGRVTMKTWLEGSGRWAAHGQGVGGSGSRSGRRGSWAVDSGQRGQGQHAGPCRGEMRAAHRAQATRASRVRAPGWPQAVLKLCAICECGHGCLPKLRITVRVHGVAQPTEGRRGSWERVESAPRASRVRGEGEAMAATWAGKPDAR